MKVYADHAATTAVHPEVLKAMLPYFSSISGNPSSLHSAGQEAATVLADARATVAKHLNAAHPDEIYFTSGGSESDNQAILSAAALGARKNKKHLISTKFEHHAVLHTLKKLLRIDAVKDIVISSRRRRQTQNCAWVQAYKRFLREICPHVVRLINNNDRANMMQKIGEGKLWLRRIAARLLILRFHPHLKRNIPEMPLHVFVVPIDIVFAGFFMDERLNGAHDYTEIIRNIFWQYLKLLIKIEHLNAPCKLTVKLIPVRMQRFLKSIRRLLAYRVARREPQHKRKLL